MSAFALPCQTYLRRCWERSTCLLLLLQQQNVRPQLPGSDTCTATVSAGQVEEKGTVSQDLELYISKDHVTDGFNLIARCEGRLQEIHLTTQKEVSEIKSLVQMVLRRLI